MAAFSCCVRSINVRLLIFRLIQQHKKYNTTIQFNKGRIEVEASISVFPFYVNVAIRECSNTRWWPKLTAETCRSEFDILWTVHRDICV